MKRVCRDIIIEIGGITMIKIRPITQDDADQFWELRLEALKYNPEAFSASYEESINKSMEAVRTRINVTEENFILGAFVESNRLIGMIGFYRGQAKKLNHKGHIWGTYVTSEFRGKGIAKEILVEIIERAKKIEGLIHINLEVVTFNEGARKLYKSVGFEVYGLERNGFKLNDQYFDEELMKYIL